MIFQRSDASLCSSAEKQVVILNEAAATIVQVHVLHSPIVTPDGSAEWSRLYECQRTIPLSSFPLDRGTCVPRKTCAQGEREREIHYIFSSHLRADQMCRGFFLGTHQ